MTYSVFVKSTETQGYNAIVLGLPFLQAEGVTKKEAIDKVRSLLVNLMTSGEIVHVEFALNLAQIVEEEPIASPTEREDVPILHDAPVPDVDSPQLWQELESLSAILRSEAMKNGRTVEDVLNKLPEIRREVFFELYGKKQVEAWEKEWKDGE